jgi:hypothetical protein
LESAGFKPVLTSADLAQYAEASADSAELRAVFHDGWLATDEWLEANHDTALRMASVGFRINAFIASNPEDAMAIHTPFLNSVAGTDFDNSIAAVAYESLHPFLPFEEQEGWHLDAENPLNGEYVIGSAIKLYEEQGVFNRISTSGLTSASPTRSTRSSSTTETVRPALLRTWTPPVRAATAADLLAEAQRNFEIFNYLDAFRFAEAAQAAG